MDEMKNRKCAQCGNQINLFHGYFSTKINDKECLMHPECWFLFLEVDEEKDNLIEKHFEDLKKAKRIKNRLQFESEHFIFDYIPRSFGLGIEIGFLTTLSIRFWIGPFYFEFIL